MNEYQMEPRIIDGDADFLKDSEDSRRFSNKMEFIFKKHKWRIAGIVFFGILVAVIISFFTGDLFGLASLFG